MSFVSFFLPPLAAFPDSGYSTLMTPNQEDALYNFLENVTEPFTLEDVTEFVRMMDPTLVENLPVEITAVIDSQNAAFRLDNRQWVSRRGCFESVPFVITPTKNVPINYYCQSQRLLPQRLYLSE